MPDPSPSTLTVYKLQLLTARKKEWRPATADSLPRSVTCQHWYVIHTTLAGLEPTTFRLLVWRATSSVNDSHSTQLTYNTDVYNFVPPFFW